MDPAKAALGWCEYPEIRFDKTFMMQNPRDAVVEAATCVGGEFDLQALSAEC